MFIGASAYFFYVLSFLSPMIWSFYLTSVLLGVGAAILWTAEGAYLAANSDEHTTSRNTVIALMKKFPTIWISNLSKSKTISLSFLKKCGNFGFHPRVMCTAKSAWDM
ncbi:unnamed protein product [Rotaria magnacalcarata]|uniref:Uncharacterized protein n=1 Tax=Rotaria magnacalcarata TaxID=392030 RepID=A0A8S2KT72_9BILA|nr:unnamed protein product [Rotaria magnacalcarata]CAF3871251.1 unnamed protein product [Rotaria magnacalcarata]